MEVVFHDAGEQANFVAVLLLLPPHVLPTLRD